MQKESASLNSDYSPWQIVIDGRLFGIGIPKGNNEREREEQAQAFAADHNVPAHFKQFRPTEEGGAVIIFGERISINGNSSQSGNKNHNPSDHKNKDSPKTQKHRSQANTSDSTNKREHNFD